MRWDVATAGGMAKGLAVAWQWHRPRHGRGMAKESILFAMARNRHGRGGSPAGATGPPIIAIPGAATHNSVPYKKTSATIQISILTFTKWN